MVCWGFFACRLHLALGRRGLLGFALPLQDALTVHRIFLVSAHCLRLLRFVITLETVQTCPDTKLTSLRTPLGTGSSQSFSAPAQVLSSAGSRLIISAAKKNKTKNVWCGRQMPAFPFYYCSSEGGIRVIPSWLAQKLSPFLFSQQVKLARQSRLKMGKNSL